MAEGGIAMDKSPSPPKMGDWKKQNPNTEMTGSLSDQLQRLLAIKKSEGESVGVASDESGDGPNTGTGAGLKKLLAEKDEMWREHERSQIAFMEREHDRTLRGLHQEVERLQNRCADLTKQLAETLTSVDLLSNMETKNSDEAKLILDLEKELKSTNDELEKMRELHERKEQKLQILEQRRDEQESRYKNELERKNKQIQEISNDLSQKAALVAQLTTQLHQLRLREAVEKQRFEQRRQLAEQQSKRRQALMASKTDTSPFHASNTKNGSGLSPSQTVPGKVTVQVAAEPTTAPQHHLRRPGVRLLAATASASPPPSARRNKSTLLPSIMTSSTPGAAAAQGDKERTEPVRKLSGNLTSTNKSMRSS